MMVRLVIEELHGNKFRVTSDNVVDYGFHYQHK